MLKDGFQSDEDHAKREEAQFQQHSRPKSDDPDFWAVWSGKDGTGQAIERTADWKSVADEWQQVGPQTQG
ncbi:hypothetical protein [Paucibacter sp. Y2R2-4]|uniref:hypothetical protein n=1 Tax=Paucibacter sp. Y2R2-4 TaxID=2893553 RepID=UPI0021E4A2D5|nr:hypothetical protein [Paucibacter sp. Y2R2-4]MCV2350828.1 hypothetical protein [Paucibacter sp. Y2R2-4]